MHYIIIAIVLLLMSIGFFISLVFEVRSITFYKNKKDCIVMNVNLNDGDQCGNWIGYECRKGIMKNGKCKTKMNALPSLLSLLSLSLFAGSIFFFVKGIRDHY